MLLTGEPISAERALQIGLVNRIAPPEQLAGVVNELARVISRASPLVIRIGKRAFYEQLPLSEAAAYEQAVEVMTRNAQCLDAREGIAAFLEKRPPQWRGM